MQPMHKATFHQNTPIPTLIIPKPGVRSVTALVLCNTGSRFETKEEQGIAHFFEHMVFKGTKTYDSAQKLASTIDALGADFNAFTGKEYTGYYVKAASRHLPTALSVLSEMVLKPLLRQEDIDREKGVIIEEMNMYHDTPMRYVDTLFERMVFPNAGLGHDVLGDREVIKSTTTERFTTFLNKWYGLENMLLVLSGDEKALEDEKLPSAIAKYFDLPNSDRAKGKIDLKSYFDPKQFQETRLHVETRKTEQAHLVLGWPGLARSSDKKHILSVLSTILGGAMSSRLFSEVREKRGLCYYVRSDVEYFHDLGMVGASAGVDPNRTTEALSVILEECFSLADGRKPITEEELVMAKEHIVGSMILSFEDSKSVAQFYGMRHLLLGEIESPEEITKKIQSVTLEQLATLAKDIFVPGQQRLAVIGPFEEKEFKQFV